MRIVIFFGIILAFFASCESEEEKQALDQMMIEEEVKRRVEEYTRILGDNCQTRVLEEATLLADSLMILEARLAKDTLFKPIKPLRPEKPELRILQDSTPVKPFLPPVKRDTSKN